MPGFDGTGPMGQGPMTGGGRGFCAMPYRAYGPYGYGYASTLLSASGRIHLMEGPLMVPSLVQAVVGFHGVEAVAESSVAGEGSVVGGGNAWGNYDGKRGSISTTG